ncbi:Protein of unknown function [Devosia crocina]|uniref:DUF3253 domain-containing protein n=1 Tax=Devosia crocina TaxID=429728 RepID=A0A1I7NUY1_9HYPH|nr:DUF3253 domain-containing protein [Devosia crocina]SFV38442.1 Protein of unknown function [Devosia crocina]
MSGTEARQQARDGILGFVRRRAGKTTCPSEVARQLAESEGEPEAWRTYMDVVHAAVDDLLEQDRIHLSWKSKSMPTRSGPYRISGRHEKS